MDHATPETILTQADYECILNSIYCAIFVYDRERKPAYCNKEARQLVERCGFTSAALMKELTEQLNPAQPEGRYTVTINNHGIVCNVKPWSKDGIFIIAHESGSSTCIVKEIDAIWEHTHDGVIAVSPEMRHILRVIHVIADVESTVLITGESGTGKEVIVNEIYQTSRRCNGPIIKINCGAIPDTLFESELFGYESGAFTGARRQGKAGFFELANKGTLLLDEVGELSMSAQVKLLRVIQEREVQRIGASHPKPIDVRIIAATNRDLWKMVQEGKFRQDLYYRLHVIHIHIPPLRERRDDIIPLACQFLKAFNEKYDKQKRLTPELARLLVNHPWPGNIRELENAMETMVVLAPGDDLLPEYFMASRKEGDTGEAVQLKKIIPWKEAVDALESELLRQAHAQYGSTRAMAEVLGINQSTISRKMKKLGIEVK